MTSQLPFSNSLGLSNTATHNLLNAMHEHSTLVTGAAVGLAAVFVVQYLKSPWRKVPPGPPGLPIIGNALQFTGEQWLKYSAWRKDYGDIIYMNAAGQPMVILNSPEVAAELLDRRAGIYSDRPAMIVASEIMCDGLSLPLARYNETWRRMRKASHEALNKVVVHSLNEYQTEEALVLARDSLHSASPGWDMHIRRATASLMLRCLYNQSPASGDLDARVRYINDFADEGAEQASFCATLIHDSARYRLSIHENAWLAASVYAAGADTTRAVLSWWALAMIVYPDVQKRAQDELDAVVGRTRAPAFADMPHLPYISAMVKEAVRWRPVTPFGLPHQSTEDDFYEGHFIPKGTVVIANVWEMNRDPEIFGADAHQFNPSRYLGERGEASPGTRDDGHYSFGFGRRVCVGKHVANNSLFIDIATCLWATTFANVKGQKLDVNGCVDEGLVVVPKPFKVDIQPRFSEALAILSQECELRSR
ncbi:cytochrome P450 [Peniophora sp. CONT]|nr:cytochrome P450 [Peniophora sp. CONT]